jgi:hypothetical protein
MIVAFLQNQALPGNDEIEAELDRIRHESEPTPPFKP